MRRAGIGAITIVRAAIGSAAIFSATSQPEAPGISASSRAARNAPCGAARNSAKASIPSLASMGSSPHRRSSPTRTSRHARLSSATSTRLLSHASPLSFRAPECSPSVAPHRRAS